MRTLTPDAHTKALLDGLIQALPPVGSTWPLEARVRWLTLAAAVFDVVYTVGEAETGTIAVSLVTRRTVLELDEDGRDD